MPDHSTFSVNRHGRFRDSDIFRQLFEAVVKACMDAGLIKGEGFAVDASVMEADASRYHGKAPNEIDWSAPERQTPALSSSSQASTMTAPMPIASFPRRCRQPIPARHGRRKPTNVCSSATRPHWRNAADQAHRTLSIDSKQKLRP